MLIYANSRFLASQKSKKTLFGCARNDKKFSEEDRVKSESARCIRISLVDRSSLTAREVRRVNHISSKPHASSLASRRVCG